MKTVKLFEMALFMAVVCGSFFACSGDGDDDLNISSSNILGTWYMSYVEDEEWVETSTFRWTFLEDGSFLCERGNEKNGWKDAHSYNMFDRDLKRNYSLADGNLYIGTKLIGRFLSLRKDRFVLQWEEYNQELVFKKELDDRYRKNYNSGGFPRLSVNRAD